LKFDDVLRLYMRYNTRPQGNRDVDCILNITLALVSQTTTLFMIITGQITSNKKSALDELHY